MEIQQSKRVGFLIAIQAIKKQEVSAVWEAARRLEVPETYLRCLNGVENCAVSCANFTILTEIEKQSL